MNSKAKNNAASLFKSAAAEGVISKSALQVINVNDIGTTINAALGVSVDDVTESEAVLVTQLIDDSGSICFGANADAVRTGHNLVLDALVKSKQNAGVLGMCRYLNGTVLYPYRPINQAEKMDTANYDPRGGTPLYDESITTLGAVLAKTQEFTDAGIPCRSVTLIVTDGADEHSRRTASDVKKVVDDMLKSENHIVAFMGIDDGRTDFRQIARDMGIRDEWILTPGNTPGDIRRAFMVFSQSAQRASQTAKSFSQTAMGGFANP